MSEGFFRATGGSGSWTEERLRKIPEYKLQILEGISSGLFLSEICQQLNIAQKTVRTWRATDKDFDETYSDAEAVVNDGLEKEAIRRARYGVLEPVISAGKVVMDETGREPMMVRRYSDSLMMFLLKGRRRETYGDKREIDAKVGIDVVGAKSSLEAKFAAATVAAEGSGE